MLELNKKFIKFKLIFLPIPNLLNYKPISIPIRGGTNFDGKKHNPPNFPIPSTI